MIKHKIIALNQSIIDTIIKLTAELDNFFKINLPQNNNNEVVDNYNKLLTIYNELRSTLPLIEIIEQSSIENDEDLVNIFLQSIVHNFLKERTNYLNEKLNEVGGKIAIFRQKQAHFIETNQGLANSLAGADTFLFSLKCKLITTRNKVESLFSRKRKKSEQNVLKAFYKIYSFNLIAYPYFKIGVDLELQAVKRFKTAQTNNLSKNELNVINELIDGLAELKRIVGDIETRLSQGLEMFEEIKSKMFFNFLT